MKIMCNTGVNGIVENPMKRENTYVSRYYSNQDSVRGKKHVKPEGHTYTVVFDVGGCWYDKVRISRVPAKSVDIAVGKAGKMLENVLPGACRINSTCKEER